jgi:predicted nucleic acid-binding protein
MKYLLDTNVISAPSRPGPHGKCLEWLAAHHNDCAISTVTLAELRYGVERLPEGKRKRTLSRKLEFIHQDYRESVLDFDQNAASEWGRHLARLEQEFGTGILDQLDYPDTQIASIALAHGLIVVTINDSDFPKVDTINPL